MKKIIKIIVLIVSILSLLVTNTYAISLSEKEDIYRVETYSQYEQSRICFDWLTNDDNFLYHLHMTSPEGYASKVCESLLDGISLSTDVLSGNIAPLFETKDDYYKALKEIILSYAANGNSIKPEEAVKRKKMALYNEFVQDLIEYGSMNKDYSSVVSDLAGIRVIDEGTKIEKLTLEMAEGEQQKFWGLLDDYCKSERFSKKLSTMFKSVSYANKGLKIAQYSYDLFVELEAYDNVDSQFIDVLYDLYLHSPSSDVSKVAGEMYVNLTKSKKEQLEHLTDEILLETAEVAVNTGLAIGAGKLAEKFGVGYLIDVADLGVSFGELVSDVAFHTGEIRKQLTYIYASNALSVSIAGQLKSKYASFNTTKANYETKARMADEVIYYTKILLQARRIGEKAYYQLKETSLKPDKMDGLFLMLCKNGKFDKVENWYKNQCNDLDTAEYWLFLDFEESLYKDLYELQIETDDYKDDFVIVDGRLIEYKGTDDYVYVPYEVNSIAPSAFNAETSMAVLQIRGTKIESRAISNCGSLYAIYIPRTVTTIENEAIYNCPNVTIYGYSGTAAETYAENNNIPFYSLGSETYINDDVIYINGDYVLSNGTLNLNNKTMYVSGDFINSNGTLHIGNGKLVIFGNYRATSTFLNYETYSGKLDMEDEHGYLLIYGNLYMQAYANTLTAGTIEVKGDFTQYKGQYWKSMFGNNFTPTGTHTVVLSGEREQNIYFNTPNESFFNNLQVKNNTGLVKFNELSVRKAIIGDLSSNDKILLNTQNLTLNAQTIKTPELKIFSDATINVCNDVIIDGDLCQPTGLLYINGNCKITGNYYITGMNDGYSDGNFVMRNENSYLTILGNFKMNTPAGSNDEYIDTGINAGVIEVKKDFINYTGFNATGNHKVILSGEGYQRISNYDVPGHGFDDGFNDLEVTNKSGYVRFDSLRVKRKIIGDIVSDYDIYLYNSTIELKNQTIRSPNLYNDSDFWETKTVLGEEAKIDGNFIHSNGDVIITGKCEITGDFFITNRYKNSYSDGRLIMTDENGYLLVDGDFVMDSSESHSDYLTAGTLDLKGNFTRKISDQYGSDYNFYASGNHTVILSGTNTQYIGFYGDNNWVLASQFNTLIIKNYDNVIFLTRYRCNEEIISYPEDEPIKLTYSISNGEVTITGCNKSATDVNIPSTIEGYPVTKIDDFAFSYYSNLVSVTIPDSVISIGKYAFCDCTNLTSVIIPNGITNISYGMFENCSSLIDVIIPDSVMNIDGSAFCGCSSLISIAIPASIKSIGRYAFLDCDCLTNINVDSSNQYYTSKDGVLFDKNKILLICCPCGKNGSYIIPDSVTSVGEYAFRQCSSLESISIPNSVTSIGNYAFENCSNLKAVIIPNSITNIGGGIFRYCSSLEDVTISNNITCIEWAMFQYCDSISNVIIPNNVTSIGDSAFLGCSNLKNISIPDNVTSIGEYAFSSCNSMTDISISKNIRTIGDWAFTNCDNLTNVYFDGSESEWNKIIIGSSNDCLTNVNIIFSKDDNKTVKGKITECYYDNGKVKVRVEFKKILEDCKVIFALYDYNKLISIFDVDAYANDNSISINIPADEKSKDYGLKVFFWNSYANLKPLGNMISSKIGNSILESTHPYACNCDETKIYTYDGNCESIDVTFSADTESESGWDYIYIYDVNDNQIGEYTGAELAGATINIPGNTVKIRLISDGINSCYGYRTESIVVNK